MATISLLGLRAVLLTLLLELPVWHGDTETLAERTARMDTVAQSVDDASLRAVCGGPWADSPDICRPIWTESQVDLAVLLLAKGFMESAYASRWHLGDCRGAEWDHGTSQSLWQLKQARWMTEAPWSSITGHDLTSTTMAAWYAAWALSYGYRHCRDLEGAISIYARGNTCRWSGAAHRLRFYQRLRRKARVLLERERGRHGHGDTEAQGEEEG